MLAGDVLTLFEGAQKTLMDSGVFDLLTKAYQLAVNRPGMKQQAFEGARLELVKQAGDVLLGDNADLLPASFQKRLEDGRLSYYSPRHVAEVIIGGFPPGNRPTMTSAEVQTWIEGVGGFNQDITLLLAALRELRVEPYKIPENHFGLAIEWPREAIEDRLGLLGKKFEIIDDLLSGIAELEIGTDARPRFVSVSTSDPMVVIAVLPELALSILHFYNELLNGMLKTLEVLSALKTWRQAGADNAQIEKQAQAINQTVIKQAIDSAFKHLKKPETPRDKEVANGIRINSEKVAVEISNGLKIEVSIQSNLIFSNNPSPEWFNQMIEVSKANQLAASAVAAAKIPQDQITEAASPRRLSDL